MNYGYLVCPAVRVQEIPIRDCLIDNNHSQVIHHFAIFKTPYRHRLSAQQAIHHPSNRHALPFVKSSIAGATTKENAHTTSDANSVTHAVNAVDDTQLFRADNNLPTYCNLPQTKLLYELGKSPINLSFLSKELKNYPNKDVAQEIFHGFRDGFSLQYSGPRVPVDALNLKSARDNIQTVLSKLEKELTAGRVAGPFASRPLPTLRVSPLGLAPKKNGDFRLIHHLSYPKDTSVNDFIDETACSVKYSSIDDAIEMVQTLDRGSELGICDIKQAFRLLPVSPADFDLLGFQINGEFYYDKCLPFGASISCSLFEKFSTFIEWAVKVHSSHRHPAILHYLDDFLFGGKKGTNECADLMDTFKQFCSSLGVPLALDKTKGPSSVIVFLGIEIDTSNMVLRLPQEKLSKLQAQLMSAYNSKKLTLQELQSLLGSLNFACRVVRPGRAFCRRLIDATIGISKSHHRIRITESMKSDIATWLTFLKNYNGTTVMPDKFWVTNDTLQLFTDSAGGSDKGFGIFFKGHWAHGQWPGIWKDRDILRNITFLELFPVVTAIQIWGRQLQNKKVIFHIDNQAVVYVVNKRTAKDPHVMTLVRRLVLLTLKFNIIFRADHIEGTCNSIADAISRCQWSKFRELAPEADRIPAKIPPEVWNL